MIEKQVILYIRGEQSYAGTSPDRIELISQGTMTIADDGEIGLEYQETELTGMAGTTTRFTIRDDTVTLTRTGETNSQMIFQLGRQHSSLYETPVGTLTVDVSTSRLSHRIDEHGGVLEVRYSISMEHRAAGRSQFKIRVREMTR